jgi:hypothetical protein
MKIKINQNQISALVETLKGVEQVRFATRYEKDMSVAVLKVFTSKLLMRAFSQKPVQSIELDEATLHCLNYVLPQIGSKNELMYAEMAMLYQSINQLCLSI